jgi:UDP-N-acetylmuramate dehydrogenase
MVPERMSQSPTHIHVLHWTATLPKVRGRYTFDFDLSKVTWFKVGGKADVLFKPEDHDDLIYFLSNTSYDIPITVLGAGSNVLVRDGCIDGVVIRLGSGFSNVTFDGQRVIVGSATLDRTLALECAQQGLAGLEFLVGIPGTIGGAIMMNAGAYGSEIKDFLEWVEYINPYGTLHRLQKSDLSMQYRRGNMPKGAIITRCCFKLTSDGPDAIHERIDAYLKRRDETQPVRGRTGGSTFKNPDHAKSAWQLIDEAGCRGLRVGDAQVSEKHCNFLLNLDHASATDLETLGETVKRRVYETSGVHLEWEIIRLGQTPSERIIYNESQHC